MAFDDDDIDVALGELLHMTKQAKDAMLLPRVFNPALFQECMRVIELQPDELRQECILAYRSMYDFSKGGRLYDPRLKADLLR